MTIQVLGSGCPTCKKFYRLVQKAVHEMGGNEDVAYLTGSEGIQKIAELGVMSSPVLVVNSEVVLVGFIPDVEKIKAAIQRMHT